MKDLQGKPAEEWEWDDESQKEFSFSKPDVVKEKYCNVPWKWEGKGRWMFIKTDWGGGLEERSGEEGRKKLFWGQ